MGYSCACSRLLRRALRHVAIHGFCRRRSDLFASGLIELRAGVYVFFDLDQQLRGVCAREDIALSVLASVIGHNRAAGMA